MDSGFRRNDVSVNELGSNYVRGEPVEPYAANVVPFAVSAAASALFRSR